MLSGYQAVYSTPSGETVAFDLAKDLETRAYKLCCGDGLRRVTWHLDGGLEFVAYRLEPTSWSSDRVQAKKFMDLLLTIPVKPKQRPEEIVVAARAVGQKESEEF